VDDERGHRRAVVPSRDRVVLAEPIGIVHGDPAREYVMVHERKPVEQCDPRKAPIRATPPAVSPRPKGRAWQARRSSGFMG
jgi:hypothetical protein